jgi:hypothetical protein
MENSNVELTEILTKLSKIQFDKVVGKSLSNDEWEVKINLRFSDFVALDQGKSSLVQLIIFAYHKGGLAVKWASENTDQNDMIAEWFMKTSSRTQRGDYLKRDQADKVARVMFKSL